MSLAKLRIAKALLIAGLVLFTVGGGYLATSQPTEDDVSVAFHPVARLTLDSFKPDSTVRLKFRVPGTAQWSRIRKAWGDHGYAVFGVSRRNGGELIIPFSELDLDVKVARAGKQMRMERLEEWIYGYSSDTTDYGVLFRPNPGDQLEVSVTRRSASLAQGDLVIAPFWNAYAKDHIVGAIIDSELRPYAWTITVLGIASLTLSASLGVLTRRQPPASG